MSDAVLQINNLSVALPKGADRSHAIEQISLSIQRWRRNFVARRSASESASNPIA
jgi:ABC-type microcin C transport system duplicated ATPase subunit YejF